MFKAFSCIKFFDNVFHSKTIYNTTSNYYLPLLVFLLSLGSFSLFLLMKEAFEMKHFFLIFFLPPSQYKFRDLTIEELKNVNKTYPNFTFSMNTYSKKRYSYFELIVILTCHRFRLCIIEFKCCVDLQ